MTDAGKNWAIKLATENAYPGRLDMAHALSSASANFWLSEFAKLVDKETIRLQPTR